jgi:O-antigen/teichoic acid export membrane protein
MPDNVSNNKRLAKNTLFLYGRMIIIMAVSLFTSRVILRTLGVQDFGIYNLVCGITALFQFLNGTLADSTQRYITFEIGKGEKGNTNKIFSTCLLLHFFLGLIIIIVAEPVGLWFLHHKLIIPPDRMIAANWVFQLSIVSLFILIISVPYNALIVAHERMKAFAMISIVEALGRLAIAYLLLIGTMDRLILYGLLMLVLQASIRFLYTFYCKKHFAESKYHYYWDWKLVKEMSAFASWTVIGNLAFICVTQGINVLLGMFFMPVVNAARGIAVQVQNAVVTFVRNFQTAINPQITKAYAAGNLSEMHSLLFRSSRFSFYLVMLPLLPILLETDIILDLWLTEVPDYTSTFIRLILIVSWVNCLANPLAVSMKATGRIKEYELYAASIKLLVLPVAFFLLKLGLSPIVPFIVYLFFESIALVSNFFIASHFVRFSILEYLKQVLSKISIVTITAACVPVLIYFHMPLSIFRFVCVLISSLLCCALSIYFFGLTVHERRFVTSKIFLLFHKE